MEAIREFLTIDDTAFDPLLRRQVRAINILNLFTTGLVVFLAMVLLMADLNQAMLNIVALNIGLGVVAVMAARYLLLRRRFTLASITYVVCYSLAVTGLSLRYGLQESTSVLAVALPIVLTAMLLGVRSVIFVTGVAVASILAMGFVQQNIWHVSNHAMADALGESVLALLIGAGTVFWVRELLRSYETLEQEEAHLNTALSLGQQIALHGQEQDLLQEFATGMQATFDLQQVQVFLREPDNPGILHLRTGAGLAAQRAVGRTFSIAEENSVTIALHSGDPVVARVSDLAYMQSELLPGSNSQLVIPLRGQDNIRGVIDFQSTDEWYFSERRIAVFQTLVFQFTSILANLTLTTRLATMENEHTELYAKVADYRAETVRLRRQVSGVVWERFFQEQGTDILGFDLSADADVPIASNIISKSMETTLKSGAVDVRKTSNGYLLSLPIVLRGQVLGALEFNIVRETDLPSYVVDLATTITERLSLALDNARLVQETQAFAHREQQISGVSTVLQGAATMEDLLALAAEQLNEVLGSSRTHIRLQLNEQQPGNQKIPDQTPAGQASAGAGHAAANGGGAA